VRCPAGIRAADAQQTAHESDVVPVEPEQLAACETPHEA